MKYDALLAPIFLLSAVGLATSGSASQAPPPAGKTTSIPASAADMNPGAKVRDSKGVQVATIVEMQDANVVLDTGQTKIAVPLNLFAKDSQGLMLTITADQFNGAIGKAHARAEAAKAAQHAATQQKQTIPPKN
jgi:hypothetical protein